MFLIYLVTVAFLFKTSECGKILFISPSPAYSHQNVFQPIWRELSLRGHKVKAITTDPLNDPSLTNLTEIDISFTYKLVLEAHKLQDYINSRTNILFLVKPIFTAGNNMTIEQLRHKEVQELINGNETFDLIISELHFPAWFGLVKKYNCPIILVTSMDAHGYMKRAMGNIYNPVFSPDINLPFLNELSFSQRVTAVLYDMFMEIYTNILYFTQQKIIREILNEPSIDLFEIRKESSLLFTNVIPGFTNNAPNIPSIIQLNSLQIRPYLPLPDDIQEFLDGATNGAIYFSLGSNIKSALISNEMRNILFEVFRNLPFRVIWKFERGFDDLPENIKIVPWTPQQDILRHKNVKLFITQGGIQSIEESVVFQVPILGLPFYGDQFQNLLRVESLNLGTWLDVNSLTNNSLKNAIIETVDNKSIKESLEEISELLTQQPSKSLDKALWWIEYVLRHRGAKYLRSPLTDMPSYQYYLLDVILFLTFVSILLLILTVKLAKLVSYLCTNARKSVSYERKNQ